MRSTKCTYNIVSKGFHVRSMWTVHLSTPIRTTPSSVCPCCAIVPSFRCLVQSFRTSENASSKHVFSSRACAICISRCRLFHMSVVWYRDMWPTNLAPGPPSDWLKDSIKGFCSQCVCRQVTRATWQRVTRTYTITCLQKWHVKRHHHHLDPIIHLKIITNLFALQRFTAQIFGAALSAPLSSMGGPFELPVQFIYTSMNLYQIIWFSSIVKHLFFFLYHLVPIENKSMVPYFTFPTIIFTKSDTWQWIALPSNLVSTRPV